MILIIGPICRHDPTTVENSSPRHWAVAPVRELIRELQDHESVIIYTSRVPRAGLPELRTTHASPSHRVWPESQQDYPNDPGAGACADF
jgi:hypothetical protein